ncbi:unnamed protein product [Bursaphelenchus okinawaensis]|uniref:Unconventional myosin-IXb n=1 Tax=Bursaphelenchus okinawaensis TaxID=465554 RepID=A0A811JSV2_9BILA|nr:unnamed protein product [Bursaphelenchus okinawaensis]CAG9082149.1 unnamed protein product [Bursaphelenchus okinawaensis]
MSFDSIHAPTAGGIFPKRALTIGDESHNHLLTVYLHSFNPESSDQRIRIEFHKRSTTEELVEKIAQQEKFGDATADEFEIFETMGTLDGRTYKERKLDPGEYPVAIQTLWPRGQNGSTEDDPSLPRHRFVLRKKGSRSLRGQSGACENSSTIDEFLAKFLQQPVDREYADLCMLPELTEQTLLENLRDRFNSGHIYTYIGPILVAVNPFKFFPIYNPKYARLYCQSRRLGALPPHIFAIADVTYHNMLRIKQNQCVVISGESGSGKTESTNFLLHHLTTLSQKGSNGSSIEQMLLSAGPVLEAFGNAVTLQNNNSSRFGKFIKVNYRENGMVSGANVEIYLLEKSRIISQAEEERNYHVFYYLLKGATEDERKRHFLLEVEDYKYLNHNDMFGQGDGINEKYEYERLKHSMEAVGFSNESQQKMFAIISAVLLLGNVEFVERPGYHSDENAYIQKAELIDVISELLGIKANMLNQALTMRRTVLKKDVVITRYHVAEAVNTRDAMAKCLYNALFHWIVLRMNQALIGRDASLTKNRFYIGILDIFGFEDIGAQWNSFEQLCINYANEHLQAYFNQHIFQFEQEEYLKEGLTWTNIEYTDNTECVQLFQSKPYGLLRLVDEESNINNGTDRSMLEKLNTFLKSNEYYEIPHKREDAFIIAHYAGKVKYQVKGFREKNKDLMRQDVMTVLKGSRSMFMKEIIANDPVAFFRWKVLRSTFQAMHAFKDSLPLIGRHRRAESVDRLLVPHEPSKPVRRGSDSHLNAFLRGDLSIDIVPDFCDTSVFKTIVNRAKKAPSKPREERQSAVKSLQAVKELIGKKPISNKPTSVSRQFEFSLSRLMKTLAQATPYFIRCIKSNNEKNPNSFDDNIILRQLRYTGMLETVRIRRAGYSVRIEYQAFVQQYRILLQKGRDSQKEDIKEFFLNHSLIEADNIQYGFNKIFMRDAEKLLLDDQLHRVIMGHIEKLQSWFRSVLARRRYLKMKIGMVRMQAWVRGMLARNQIRNQHMAALLIQSWWRKEEQRQKFKQIKDVVTRIQAWYRGQKFRAEFELMRKQCPKKLKFELNKVHRIDLPSFNLNDPKFFSTFSKEEIKEALAKDILSKEAEEAALEDTDVFSSPEDEEVDNSGNWDSSDIDLDATFILEDTKLKLIGEIDKGFQRRQSLATTAPTAKLKMLRRAASTESDQLQRRDLESKIQSPTTKMKFHKLGFTKARKHLKALLTRKDDLSEEDFNEAQTSISTDTEKLEMDKKSHSLKMTRIHKASDSCSMCNKPLSSLLVQGYKCSSCKLCFHKECSTFSANIPCVPMSPLRDSMKKPYLFKAKVALAPLVSTFNLTKTKQQTDPTAMLIETTEDLRQFSMFIFQKQCQLEQEKKRDTVVDAVFKKSLREFHMELIGCEAVLTEGRTVLRYRDLITTFEGLLTKMCAHENITFPTTLGVNAFRGFLNGFMQKQMKRRGSHRRTIINTVRKKRRRSDVTILNGHRFKPDFVHVPTYCEVCNQFMWHAEKIFICDNCRLSCHKKCHSKINGHCSKPFLSTGTSNFFGVDLSILVGDELTAPPCVNNMFMAIEVKSLFIEGIYRKSGSLAAVKTIRRQIEESVELDTFDFSEIPVHVLTTIIKLFFRELREPLITYELYENFIHVSEVTDTSEKLKCLSVVVDMLPKPNKVILDRLMYHLARVAHQEMVNKMNASNLAVIFAPCILRRNQAVHAQEQLEDVQKQAVCVQMLIEEKLRQYKATLNQIVELEQASEKVSENLRRIQEHRRSSDMSEGLQEMQRKIQDATDQLQNCQTVAASGKEPNIETARLLFEEQLDFLDQEKSKLIQELPPLAPVASSEDLTSNSTENGRTNSASPSMWSNSDVFLDEYAIDMEAPPVLNRLPSLYKKHPKPHSFKGQKKPSAPSNPQ